MLLPFIHKYSAGCTNPLDYSLKLMKLTSLLIVVLVKHLIAVPPEIRTVYDTTDAAKVSKRYWQCIERHAEILCLNRVAVMSSEFVTSNYYLIDK